MRNRNALVITVLALLVGAAAGFALSQWRSNSATESSADTPPAHSAQQDRKVLYWHDPMVPGAKFDKPGKSPFMDMQLVPAYADEEGGAAVRIQSSVAQNLGIRLGKVERRRIQQQLRAVGGVAFDERRIAVVQSRVSGSITRLYVRSPLERVQRGQPLAEIVSPEWAAAQQEYLALLDADTASSKTIREATRERLIVLGVPLQAIRAIETDRKVEAATIVRAPINGVVAELSVREGSSFMAGGALLQINDLSHVWVNAQVPEAQVSLIPMGSAVEVRATAWPGTTFEGRVIALLPNVDTQTRTLAVRIGVENQDYKLVPGMYVSLDFGSRPSDEQLTVPSEAIIMTGQRNAVIVAREHGGFDVADVTVGAEADGHAAILRGLSEGQQVVLSGQFLIDSEASLRSAVTRLSATAEESEGSSAIETKAPKEHLTEGTITAIEGDQITLAHEPVPSMNWPAMTMGFKAPVDALPSDLKVGDRVTFSFIQADDSTFQIKTIVRAAEKKPLESTGARP